MSSHSGKLSQRYLEDFAYHLRDRIQYNCEASNAFLKCSNHDDVRVAEHEVVISKGGPENPMEWLGCCF